MVLHGTWTKANVFSSQNCFPGCQWIQIAMLGVESVTKIVSKLTKNFQR
uniref:Transcriptional activator protein Pur-beta n=1 Tax=Pan troglodytes TaxID=9598 RepID=G2HEZ0_PANTR|nr:transcriptional activator protein Pur-beta [Pan troglodytes]